MLPLEDLLPPASASDSQASGVSMAYNKQLEVLLLIHLQGSTLGLEQNLSRLYKRTSSVAGDYVIARHLLNREFLTLVQAAWP